MACGLIHGLLLSFFPTDQPDSDERAQVIKGDQVTSDRVIQVPSGPITRARARKIRESLQALVCTIQDRVGGGLRIIEGLDNEDSTLYTFLQVEASGEED